MSKNLLGFTYLTFDVVGTLIDFEAGIKGCLAEIAAEAGTSVDGEAALSLYREARYTKDADLFPDDLVRVYSVIAPKLGLPTGTEHGERLRIRRRAGPGSPTAKRRWPVWPNGTS